MVADDGVAHAARDTLSRVSPLEVRVQRRRQARRPRDSASASADLKSVERRETPAARRAAARARRLRCARARNQPAETSAAAPPRGSAEPVGHDASAAARGLAAHRLPNELAPDAASELDRARRGKKQGVSESGNSMASPVRCVKRARNRRCCASVHDALKRSRRAGIMRCGRYTLLRDELAAPQPAVELQRLVDDRDRLPAGPSMSSTMTCLCSSAL